MKLKALLALAAVLFSFDSHGAPMTCGDYLFNSGDGRCITLDQAIIERKDRVAEALRRTRESVPPKCGEFEYNSRYNGRCISLEDAIRERENF